MAETEIEVIVLGEAEAIKDARQLLRVAQERVWNLAWGQAWNNSSVAGSAATLAKLAHALDVAADALFEVINIASSHCDCDASGRVLREMFPDDRPS